MIAVCVCSSRSTAHQTTTTSVVVQAGRLKREHSSQSVGSDSKLRSPRVRLLCVLCASAVALLRPALTFPLLLRQPLDRSGEARCGVARRGLAECRQRRDSRDELMRRRRDPRAVVPFTALDDAPASAHDLSGRPGRGGATQSARPRQALQPVAHTSREKRAAGAEEAWAPAREKLGVVAERSARVG